MYVMHHQIFQDNRPIYTCIHDVLAIGSSILDHSTDQGNSPPDHPQQIQLYVATQTHH
jgi:hypothetical protein